MINLEHVTEYQHQQSLLFAKYSTSSSVDEYGKRNQYNINKIQQDIYNGKVSEFMVYNYLKNVGKSPSSPDLNIYEKKEKSYDADIIVGNANIHVKSHCTSSSFPVSWMFQKNDPLVIWKPQYNFLCLVVLDKIQNYMFIKDIRDVEFSEPKKESLKSSKVCIYMT